VRIAGAGVGGDLDFTAGTFDGLQTEGVFIGVDARLPAPRQETEIRMNGVFNSLSLVVPDGIRVRVHGAGLPFNAVDRGVRGLEGRPGYDVRVQGIFSAVEVRTDRAISPEPPPLPASPASPVAPAPSTAPERPPAEARPRRPPRAEPQASCSRNSPKSFTNTLSTTIARRKWAARTYHTYSAWPRSFT